VTRPRLAFLGPEGTFTSEAAERAVPGAERLPLPTIDDVIDAVRAGEVEVGVVPIENSIEGSVNMTIDALAFGRAGAVIRGEVAIPVSMNLIVQPGRRFEDIREVRSKPHALAQCREFLRSKLPNAQTGAATSTAEAARQVAESNGELAALGARAAAERFGLEIAAADIQDHTGNATRFVVLGRRIAAPTGADKTSLVVFFGEDRPGLLMRVLDEFALRGINLTKIESRPTKQALGEYCIFIDAAGHLSEPHLAEALRSVHRHVHELRVLGSYPRADGVESRPDTADARAAYERAADWYARLLEDVDRA
jgi:prephenate dehydratase